MAKFTKIAGGSPKEGTLMGGMGGAVAGSQHPNRNHTLTKQGWTSSMDMSRKMGAQSSAGSAAGEHGPGRIGGRKSHVAGDGYSTGAKGKGRPPLD